MEGHLLSHYKIVEKLGEGGMGVVYKAEDLTLGRFVAIKVFPSISTASAEERARFFQEARLASSLNHPNIVTIHEFDETDGTAFIVSECVDGKTLTALMHEGRLSVPTMMNIAIQIASGISAAHAKGIVHRDIKPDNVMVANDGPVKVMDFGLARLLGSSHMTSAGSLIGTFAYMSPEQIDEQEVDARSDIFSFGTLMYHMATGIPPFTGKTIAELLASVTRKSPQPPSRIRPEIPEELERIILKALQKERSRRYPTMQDLKTDLESVREHPATDAQKNAFRPPGRKILAIVVAASILGGGGYLFRRFLTPGASTAQPRSIAVLPFANESAVDSINFLSIGFADDIITRLSHVRSLTVKPTSAIARFQNQQTDVVEAGKELQADYILEGRYRKNRGRFTVSAQLVDAQSGNVVWSDQSSADIPWADMQLTQDRVVNHIVDALRLELTSNEYDEVHKLRTGSAEAYECYLRGVALTVKDSRENNELAAKMFERAISLDESFAEAYASVSNVYTERFWSNYSHDTSWVGRGETAAQKAIALNPRLAAAHAYLGFAYRVKGNYRASILEAVRALELDPHTSFSLEDLSEFYRNRGDFTTALEFARQASVADPSFNLYRVRARIFQFEGKYRESIAELERAIQRSPQDSWLRGALLAMSYIHLGELSKAGQEIKTAESMDPDKPETHVTRAMLYTVQGNETLARQELEVALKGREEARKSAG